MRVNILMPKFGMTMESGVVSEWLKNDGDAVKADEDIATIETDKIVNQAQAPANGILRITAETFEDLHVGEVIGYIETDT